MVSENLNLVKAGLRPYLSARSLVFTVLLCLAAFDANATRRFVKTNGSTAASQAANAISWSTACNDLQAVINASAANDEIWVAAGVYTPNRRVNSTSTIDSTSRDNAFLLKNGVKIYGGFPANADDATHVSLDSRYSDTLRKGFPSLSETVLSGDLLGNDIRGDLAQNKADNVYHVVVALNIPANGGTVLDGFTVRGGCASTSTSLTVSSISMRRNYGAGIFVQAASPVFSNLFITECLATSYGGGVYAQFSASSAVPRFVRLTVSGNKASDGGGLYLVGKDGGVSSDKIRVENCAVTGNHATNDGGGLYVKNNVMVFSSTVAGNLAGNLAGGMYYDNGGKKNSSEFYNSVFWGNKDGTGSPLSDIRFYTPNGQTSGDHISNFYYCYGGGGLEAGIIGNPAEGIPPAPTVTDPFIGPIDPKGAGWKPTSDGDYRLKGTLFGAAVDLGSQSRYKTLTGVSNLKYEVDLDGRRRYFGRNLDMGAYEAQFDKPLNVKPGAGGIVYVKENGAGLGDGSSWDNAYPGLADPVLLAYLQRYDMAGTVDPADVVNQIWVAAGTYKPGYAQVVTGDIRDNIFWIHKDMKLYGGFPADASDSRNSSLDSRFNGTCKASPCLVAETVLSGDLDGDDLPDDL